MLLWHFQIQQLSLQLYIHLILITNNFLRNDRTQISKEWRNDQLNFQGMTERSTKYEFNCSDTFQLHQLPSSNLLVLSPSFWIWVCEGHHRGTNQTHYFLTFPPRQFQGNVMWSKTPHPKLVWLSNCIFLKLLFCQQYPTLNLSLCFSFWVRLFVKGLKNTFKNIFLLFTIHLHRIALQCIL